MPLPFKGPDSTLFQLLGFVVQAGQRFATITDLKVGDGNQQAAVGTTVAMLEQGTRVMSAIHKRLHYAMKQEFKLLAKVMSEYLPQEYPYSIENAEQSVMASDFDDRVDIIPVSNPNIFSQAQRIALAQTQMQLAAQAPELHNMYEAFRRMYEALGVRDIDKILRAPSSDEPIPKDPAQENIDALENTELKAFEGQDHDAHIMAHLVFGSSPLALASPKVAIDLQKHVMEHAKLKAQEQTMILFMQQNQGLSPTEDQMIEYEAMTAQIIAQEMQNVKMLSAQIAGGGEQGADPVVALKQQELGIKQQQAQADALNDQAKIQLERQKMAERARQFDERIDTQTNIARERIQATNQREMIKQRNKGK
jgi:hypothetical protein